MKSPFLFNSIESLANAGRNLVLSLIRPKYFSADPPDYQPLPFKQVVNDMTVILHHDGDIWRLTTQYAHEQRTTLIHTFSNFDPTKPTLIFHHGASQTNPTHHLELVFGKHVYTQYNCFAIHAQHHLTKNDYLHNSVDTYLHNQETFAGSVHAVQELTKFHRQHSLLPVIVVGTSMGGIVAALHAFYYGTADLYFPIVAYPNVGEIFLSRAYQSVVNGWETKRHNPAYPQSFQIGDFDHQLLNKVFPILGSQDKIVGYAQAAKFWQDRDFQVTTYPYGHFTPAIVAREIRELIAQKLTALN